MKKYFDADYGSSFVSDEFIDITIQSVDDIDMIKKYPLAKAICLRLMKQKEFEYFVKNYAKQFEFIDLFKCNLINDLSLLGTLDNLKYIKSFWNYKTTKLWNMTNNKSLIGIDFAEYTKISSLNEITTAPALDIFKLSGELTLDTLLPLSKTKLKQLKLGFKKLLDDDIKPIAKMVQLQELSLGTICFGTEQFAWLAVHIPNVKCEEFNPFVELYRNEILIVGKRKPILNKEKDTDRIEKYVSQFNNLVAKYKQEQ
jgi:hypothetical protein